MTTGITDDLLIEMQKNIKPLNMNGLSGRMLKMPASKKLKNKREILLIYGTHASLERMYGIAELFNDYGSVTMPDLPGFGGMDSFYELGMKPTVDNFADYLAAFVKLRYKNKKIVIAGMSLGFIYVTRMLQRYPELTKQVEFVISIVGFTTHRDFKFSENRKSFYRIGSKAVSNKVLSSIFYNTALQPTAIKLAYSKTYNAKQKFSHLSAEERKTALDFEVLLWRQSDLRTYMYTTNSMMIVDNCIKRVDATVHHISIDNDQYFDPTVVEQHMRVIYSNFTEHVAHLTSHAPSILASKEEAAPIIPVSLKRVMKKKKK